MTPRKLAIDGGKPAVTAPLAHFNNIGEREAESAYNAVLNYPLSGYLAGQRLGGRHVNRLEEAWAALTGAKYAVAVNSATSGILIACMAAGVGKDTIVNCPSYTMSGSVAPAVILGADINFVDIDPISYCLPDNKRYDNVTISVGLFGHSAYAEGRFVIQDNAQAFLAQHGNADISVYSLNVHKQIQAGEGGICVTNEAELAYRMQMYRNHGEVCSHNIGLNLRMTEVTAAIAAAQVVKAPWILSTRTVIAEAMNEIVKDIPFLRAPSVLEGCNHSWYMWAVNVVGRDRSWLVKALNAEGVPVHEGYTTPLHRLSAFSHFKHKCPLTEMYEDVSLITYENCMFSPTKKHLKQFAEAFQKVTERK